MAYYQSMSTCLPSGKYDPMIEKLRPAFIIIAIGSLIALLHMPYGYYTLLRLAIFSCGIAAAILGFRQRGAEALSWGCVAFVVLFNPLVPIHMHRSTWTFFNIAAAVFFGWLAFYKPPEKDNVGS